MAGRPLLFGIKNTFMSSKIQLRILNNNTTSLDRAGITEPESQRLMINLEAEERIIIVEVIHMQNVNS